MSRKTGVLLSYVLMIFEVLSTLLLTPFIIRTLGQAEYGVYKLAAAINAYLLLLDLGIGNAVTRYIAKFKVNKDKNQEEKFLGVATLFYMAIALIALIIGAILVAVFPKAFAKGLSINEIILGQRLLVITMVNTAIMLGTTAYNNVIIAYERFDVAKGASIIQIIIRMALTYLALKYGMGSVGIVSVNLVMTILFRGYFAYFVINRIQLHPIFKGIQSSFVKEIIAYSAFILIQMVATQLNATVDQILIGSLVSSSSVILAIYGVGTQVVQYYQSIGSAFNGVLMPGIVKMVENGGTSDDLIKEMIRVSRIIFMVLGMIWGVFLINGKEFIILWAGIENKDAYLVSLILMTAYMFVLSESVGTQILWALNEHKEQAILKFSIVIANIALTILLIKWRPLIGATIGTFISIIIGDVFILNIIFAKKLHMNIFIFYQRLLKGIVPSIIVMIMSGLIIRLILPFGWIGFLFKSLIMVCAYALCMLLFGMNRYEKELFASILNGLMRKQ